MYLKSFKELIVWQRAVELTREIYSSAAKLPKSEIYGLVSQMRRAAIAIPSNIAEGLLEEVQKMLTTIIKNLGRPKISKS